MDAQAGITAMWDRASEKYDTHTGHGMNTREEEAAWTDALRTFLPPPPADVLDIGTGTGVIALLLGKLGYSVRGIDLSEKMLARARQKLSDGGQADVRFEFGNAIEPSGAPESVDVVFNRHLVHLLTDPRRAFSNWHRLLRPGGRVVIIDGLWGQDPEDVINEDIQASLPLRSPDATTEDVRRLLEAAGFVDVAVSDIVEIDRIERELATPQDEPSSINRYVVIGRKPGSSAGADEER